MGIGHTTCIDHKMSIEQESVLDIKRISDTMCVLDMKHVFNSSTTSVPNIFRYDKYRVSQEECARFRESVPYVKLYRYNPKHLYPKLNGYGDNGQRSLKL